MTEEEEQERTERAAHHLGLHLDYFINQVKQTVESKLNDSISVEEVLGSHDQAQLIALGWVARILLEDMHAMHGPERVAAQFEHMYYQICGQKLGPHNFAHTHEPRIVREQFEKRHAMTEAASQPESFTTQIQFNDDTGEYFIQFPEEFMAAIGWDEGDTLVWTLLDDGRITIHRKEDSDNG